MPEAVIVDAVRTPIGRAFKGSLAQLRPDEMGAFVVDALLERNPERRSRARRGGLLRRRPAAGAAGLQPRADHRAAVREASARHQRHDGVALLRVDARVDPPGGQRDRGGPGRRLHRRRRGVGLALQRGRRGRRARRTRTSTCRARTATPDAYISMGLTAENVAERYEVSRARHGQVRPALAGAGRGSPRRTATSTARSCR